MKRQLISGILALTSLIPATTIAGDVQNAKPKEIQQVKRTYIDYSQLDDNRLANLVRQRQKQAEDKELVGKTALVYRYQKELGLYNFEPIQVVGEETPKEELFVGINTEKQGDTQITNAGVEYNGRVVFSYIERTFPTMNFPQIEITAYVPGEWEKKFDGAYEEAKKILSEEIRKNQIEEKRAAVRNFGLESVIINQPITTPSKNEEQRK